MINIKNHNSLFWSRPCKHKTAENEKEKKMKKMRRIIKWIYFFFAER